MISSEQPDRGTLVKKANYRRVRHPQTGRFMFAIDTERMIVLIVDRGKEAYIDLADLADKNE